MPNVLLLRSPDPVSPDRYHNAIRALGSAYHPMSIPVLETALTNVDKLRSVLLKGPQEAGYDAVVITSKRSCEAIAEALVSCDDERDGVDDTDLGCGRQRPEESVKPALRHDLHHLHHHIIEKWSCVPFYVVGDGTASSLRDAFTPIAKHPSASLRTPPASTVPPVSHDQDQDSETGGTLIANSITKETTLDIRGQESGNANVLGPFILSDLAESTPPSPSPSTHYRGKRLLYLTGDKNRDTLPSILTGPESEHMVGGVDIDELQVYRTEGSASFESDLVAHIHSLPSPLREEEWWIVHFAPSAANFAHPILQKHFVFRPTDQNGTGKHQPYLFARVAAIGPTTDDALRHQLGVCVDIVSPKPSPGALAKEIHDFDGNKK